MIEIPKDTNLLKKFDSQYASKFALEKEKGGFALVYDCETNKISLLEKAEFHEIQGLPELDRFINMVIVQPYEDKRYFII